MTKRGRPKKLTLEHRYLEVLTYSDDMSDADHFKSVELSPDLLNDSVEMERFIEFLPADEVILILFRYMGYSAREIMALLGIRRQRTYYEVFNSLKIHYHLFKTLHKDFD